MMNKWQDRELNDMFDYFNVDGDETIGIDELKTAIDNLVMHEQSRPRLDFPETSLTDRIACVFRGRASRTMSLTR